MSIRASIIFKDNFETLYFYRHSDGYPKETGKDLKSFCKGYQKHLRNSAMQSAGHLIVRGADNWKRNAIEWEWPASSIKMYEWKVGNYEPTGQIHGDVEYIYVIDLEAMVLETRTPLEGFWDNSTLENTEVIETYSFAKKSADKRGVK